jgi:hypothetical protein
MSGSERFALRSVELGEVLHQPPEDRVAVLGVAELALVVEVDAREHAAERSVLVLERQARLVERLADVGRHLLDLGPPRALGDEELVLVRVLGVGASRRPALASSSNRSERRFRNSNPKM